MKTPAMTSPGKLEDLYAPVRTELEAFRSLLESEMSSTDALIHDIQQHILSMRGKYLRPALTLLSARLGGKSPEASIKLAVAVELIHTATLVHDDIIDESEYRRNRPSVHSKYGRDLSIVAGDYLYAKSFMLIASIQDPWISQALSACARVMCEGEMKQIEKRSDYLMSQDEYLRIIYQKTAILFQASCAGGAYLGGLGLEGSKRLGDYGENLGMAFQIVDDCLDLTQETRDLGKTAGLDVEKNDVTLPVLYLFEALAPADRAELLAEVRSGAPDLFAKVRDKARSTGAIDRALERAGHYTRTALGALERLPASTTRDTLSALARFCYDRAY